MCKFKISEKLHDDLMRPMNFDQTDKSLWNCKVQPRHALLSYPFCNTAAHMEAMPTREGI